VRVFETGSLYRFSGGSRVRLDVTSSDFPNFDRNHNTGGEDWAEDELRVANQTVFHDSSRPSRITLPVAASDALTPATWTGK
jgi:predicted acyl esterase